MDLLGINLRCDILQGYIKFLDFGFCIGLKKFYRIDYYKDFKNVKVGDFSK